jgi:hypothetical protein
VSPVKYELCFYIPEDDILHIHRRDILKSCIQSVQVKEDMMVRACSINGERKNAYKMLVGKSEGKSAIGGTGRRWVDNFKTDLRYNQVLWTGLIFFIIETSGI